MIRPTVRLFLTALAIIAMDVAVYVVIGLLLMDYDDSYDAAKGAYWSLGSMTPRQQAVYIALHVWHVVNVGVLVNLVYKGWIRLRNR